MNFFCCLSQGFSVALELALKPAPPGWPRTQEVLLPLPPRAITAQLLSFLRDVIVTAKVDLEFTTTDAAELLTAPYWYTTVTPSFIWHQE